MDPLAKKRLLTTVYQIPIPDAEWSLFVEICAKCDLDYEVERPQVHSTLIRMELGDYNRYVKEKQSQIPDD